MAKIRSYEAEGIRVTYDAARCIHAAECVRGLPDVFDPERKPWIDAGAASPDELAAIVRCCPTGALAYERLDGGPQEEPAPGNELRVVSNGPIYASGDFVLLDADRRELSRESRAAFCRCGASLSKPFCDGRHVEAGFEDSGKLGVPKLRATGEADPTELTVRLRADGPLVLEGRFRIEGADGAAAKGAAGALCRCGASKNKPFCDGTHRNVGFAAEDPTAG
ncbi:MAG: CDGSH iron-sulfur domain-containing protein [Gemmatimonadetes bacterium]|nr:CDGSH iron-sulfur domain-containing protein [Gemmatimonadota bacterium]